MKKLLTVLLAATLAGTIATTVFAAPESTSDSDTDATAVEITESSNPSAVLAAADTVAISAITEGNGKVASAEYSSEPVFYDEAYAKGGVTYAAIGSTILLNAKADEGWRFVYWVNDDTNEFFSMSATIPVDAVNDLHLKAVFADDSMITISAIIEGNGQITSCDFDAEPVFDDEFPVQHMIENVPYLNTIRLSAKADEGWRFVCWMNDDTDTVYSTNSTIPVDAVNHLNLRAVFANASLAIISAMATSGGQVAFSVDHLQPVFDDSKPLQHIVINAAEGDTVTVSAKADEGFVFTGWYDSFTDELVSADETFLIEVTDDQNIQAHFEEKAEEEESTIHAEHTMINWGRNGGGIVIRTDSASDTVAIRIDGGTAATDSTEGLRYENGTLTISKELADKLLKDGQNTLHLIFSDGTLEVRVYVTNELLPIQPGMETVKTGDTTPVFAVSVSILASLSAALFLAMKHKKDFQK